MTFEQKNYFQSLNNNPRSFLILAGITIILALIAIPPLAHAAEVTLAWNSSEGASGYNLYCRLETEAYDDTIDVGKNLQHTLTHLSGNQTYYCAVTAYNEFGESGHSDEISFKTTADGGNEPPPDDTGNDPPPDDTGNQAPTADAGEDQTVDERDSVTLDGSYSSDPDDGIKIYKWKQIEGTPVKLSDSNAIEPRFICPEIGSNGDTLTFRLTVTDYSGVAASDTVKIYVNDITDNGALKISNLNGFGATPKIGEGLVNGAACYTDRSYSYSNIPDFLQGAMYIKTAYRTNRFIFFPFMSFDTNAWITVYVAFDSRHSLPGWLSDFTDTGHDLRTDVSLSIYAKDFPPGRVNLGPNGHGGSMYTVIIVGDSIGDSGNEPPSDDTGNDPPPDDDGNQAPTADAGEDQTADEGDTVLLDGSYSSDPDDGIKTYQWKQTKGTPVKLSDSNAIEPNFICPDVGSSGDTLTFRLTVTDFSGGAASDTVKIHVDDIDEPSGGVDYCEPTVRKTRAMWISSVASGNYSNDSAAGGYSDFTSEVLEIRKARSYLLRLSSQPDYSTVMKHWRVWADFNQDGDFDDSGEKLLEISSTDTINEQITIPFAALKGYTRLRVSMGRMGYPNSCGNIYAGEVEDYTLSILGY